MDEHDERTTIAALTADRVLYRDLNPCDPALPRLHELQQAAGLLQGELPRKHDADYATVIWTLLQHIRTVHRASPLRLVLLVGDSTNDRVFADHLRAVADCRVLACIGMEQPAAPPALTWDGDTATINRWGLLPNWWQQAHARCGGAATRTLLAQTALILDVDKTLLGARGQCDDVIDVVRQTAALAVANLWLPPVQRDRFGDWYALANQPRYHLLTRDNQDYIVYLALLLASDTLTPDTLEHALNAPTPAFGELLGHVAPHVPPALRDLHHAFTTAYHAGDPTPFKVFRHAEYCHTVEQMQAGALPLNAVLIRLGHELVAGGALCMAASDKPRESALPTAEQQRQGMLPLHHVVTRRE